MNVHLNEEQLYGLLDAAGKSDEVALEHLDWCPQCRGEVEGLRSSLASFQQAAGGISAAYTPSRLLNFSSARQGFFARPRLAWVGGLAAALVFGVASVSVLHGPVAPPALTQTAAVSADAQSDEALLEDIDQDLSTSVPPSLEPLSTPAASEKTILSNMN